MMAGHLIESTEATTIFIIQPKKGIVTIPHPVKDMDPRTANSIKRQAGLK
jgi:predicted RNA binding protein YcfA (HicA-like mRNA interferase family)